MTNFDNLEKIKELDKQNVLGSIEALPNQCLHAWEDAPKSRTLVVSDISRRVLSGMRAAAGEIPIDQNRRASTAGAWQKDL